MSNLLCHKYVPMALMCLPTLQKNCDRPVRFLLHDDGSLTEEDMDLLAAGLTDYRVIRRKEADERMAEELARFPASAAFRRETVMALKLCDSLYYNTDDLYVYTDSDILFFRPFKNMFQLPDKDVHALFMHDAYDNCYSFRFWELLATPSVKLPSRVNAGFACLRRSQYDPEWVEWFLSGPAKGGRRHHGVPEQTAWAAMGLKLGCRKWDPRYVTVMLPDTPAEDMVVGHFTGFTRDRLDQCARDAAAAAPRPPVEVATVDPGRCTPLDLFVTESLRVSKRIVKRLRKQA